MRLARDPHWPAPWTAVLGWFFVVAAVGMPVAAIVGSGRAHSVGGQVAVWSAYTWLGVMFLLFTAVLATDVGRLAIGIARRISASGGVDADRRTFIARITATVAENQPSNTTVGTLTTTDPDAGNTFTYTLVTGTGDADNGSFTVVGDLVKTAASFDFETKNSYTIRVRTTDQGGLFFEKSLTINVTNVNEPPTITSNGGTPLEPVNVSREHDRRHDRDRH